SLGALLAWQRPRRLVHGAIALLLLLDVSLMVLASPYRMVIHALLAQPEAWLQLLRIVLAIRRIALAGLAQPESGRQLLGIVNASRGIVLADEDVGLLPIDGRPIYLQPFEMTHLARAGRWDQRAFLADIEPQ